MQGDVAVLVAVMVVVRLEVVDVDPELGLVKVVRVDTAQDVGKILNPQAAYGQIEGGIAQGLGLAVMEEILVTDGLVRNPSFTDYLIPTHHPDLALLWITEPDHAQHGHAPGSPEAIATLAALDQQLQALVEARSDERRVGEECRSRWSPSY